MTITDTDGKQLRRILVIVGYDTQSGCRA